MGKRLLYAMQLFESSASLWSRKLATSGGQYPKDMTSPTVFNHVITTVGLSSRRKAHLLLA